MPIANIPGLGRVTIPKGSEASLPKGATIVKTKKPSNKGAKVVRTITGARGFGSDLPKTRTSKTRTRTIKREPKIDTEAQLKEKLRQQAIANKTLALQQRKETALSELGAERSKVAPLFKAQRRQLSKRSQQSARSMADFLANRGASKSGGAISLEAGRQGALTGGLTDIGLAETQKLGDIARQEQLVGSAFARDLESIKSGAETTLLQDQLANIRTDQAQERKDFGQTISRFSDDYQAEINRIQNSINNGDRSEEYKIPFLQAERQKKISGLQSAELAQKEATRTEEQKAQDQAFDRALTRFKEVGKVITDEDARILGIPKGTKSEQITVTELQGRNRASGSPVSSVSTPADLRVQAIKNLGSSINKVSSRVREIKIANEIAKLKGISPTINEQPKQNEFVKSSFGDDEALAQVRFLQSLKE